MTMIAHKLPNIEGYVTAVERVAALLKTVASALDAAGIPYAIIGGNAVAAWVSTVDEDAVRATKDVDILLRRSDLDAAAAALAPVGLVPAEALGVPMFLEAQNPSPKRGVHVIIANEPVRIGDVVAAPDPVHASQLAAGFRVIALEALIRMKLQANRLVDRTHIADLIGLGLITPEMVTTLPHELRVRFDAVADEVARNPQHPGL